MVRVLHIVSLGAFSVLVGLGGMLAGDSSPKGSDEHFAQRSTADDPCGLGWQQPVDAEIVDRFRAPEHRYGPGNRGLEYGTLEGQPVGAVADGRVVFAGPVGGRWFVVVLHQDDLRSTYAGVHDLQVGVGDVIGVGSVLASADQGFHLTARIGETYVDPELLMADHCFVVRLVPVPAEPPS